MKLELRLGPEHDWVLLDFEKAAEEPAKFQSKLVGVRKQHQLGVEPLDQVELLKWMTLVKWAE